jgi:hypothetical protein
VCNSESINIGACEGNFYEKRKNSWEVLLVKTANVFTVSKYVTSNTCMQLIVFAFKKKVCME